MASDPQNETKRRQEEFVQERRSELKPRKREGKKSNKKKLSDSFGITNKTTIHDQRIHEYRLRQKRKSNKEQPEQIVNHDDSKATNHQKEKNNE